MLPRCPFDITISGVTTILVVLVTLAGCRTPPAPHQVSIQTPAQKFTSRLPSRTEETRTAKKELPSDSPDAESNLLPTAHESDSSPSETDSSPSETETSPSETETAAVFTSAAEDQSPPIEQTAQPITMAAVLETIDRDNPTVGYARMRINEAYAQWQRANILWLPSLRGGVNYNKHEGRIQDVIGTNIDTSRGAFYTGLGANAVGASSPAIPGIYANFQLTDAIFQPRIAAEVAAAREANAQATTNDFLLQASQAYWELLRAEQERAIAGEIHELAARLSKVTDDFARTGQGLAADADRLRTELSLRRNDLTRAEENCTVTSARLAQLLSGDPAVPLHPLEPAIVPVELVPAHESVHALVAQGLSHRPEVRESHSLVCEAVQRLQRERYAPLIPSLLLGVSYGGFGAGLGGNINRFADRFDGDAIAYWELRNLGLGDSAARSEAGSRVDQTRLRQVAMMDQIAREVVETHAQVASRRRQIEVARDAVTQARASYDKNIERISNAQGLPLEALQSIQALAQAQREYLRAVIDHNQAQFALHRALGWPPGLVSADQ